MDLIKIGKYIAGKRKQLGLTQKQLANFKMRKSKQIMIISIIFHFSSVNSKQR